MARILVIEDNLMNLEMVKFLLESSGHQCITAADGPAAFEVAQTDPPDIILLDIQLPIMDGYAVMKQLKKMELVNEVPIIAVSSYAMVGDKERALAAGFDGYISKPIKPETFIQEVMALAGMA